MQTCSNEQGPEACEEPDFSFLECEQFRGQLWRFFRRAGRTDADDLVQATLLAALRAKQRFRGVGRPRDFVLAIARHTLLSRYRQLSKEAPRRSAEAFSEDELLASDESPELDQHDEPALQAVVDELPEELRRVVQLMYWEHRTQAEIAAVIGIPPGTVASRLRRARELLRSKLEPQQ
jgi:RNA polymerase sigma-70 factor (ECF subfamily)